MPSIRKPSASEIVQQPRAFALLSQLNPDESGAVEPTVLAEYLKLYGGDGKAPAADSLSFEEFAALFAKPATPVPGEGNCVGYAAPDKASPLVPFRFDRRPVGPTDVRIQITHAGICHSDVHQARNEWGGSLYPMVPGHEIVGIVTEVGPEVKGFAVGDRAGVGCMVNACQSCHFCKEQKEEQFCKRAVYTYNSKDWRHGDALCQGGYSSFIVVEETFAIRVPKSLPMDKAAPLLCAGITVYSPMRHFGLDKPGMRLGVVGLGGLGHMAVKFGKAFGCHVTVISTSPSKEKEAREVLGADAFVVSKDPEQMKAAIDSLDGMVDTVSAARDLTALFSLVRVDGTYINVGVPENPPALSNLHILKRIRVCGSQIGGIKETQEMMDFCGDKDITPLCETIPVDYVNDAYGRVTRADVRYRFVIDIQGSLVQ